MKKIYLAMRFTKVKILIQCSCLFTLFCHADEASPDGIQWQSNDCSPEESALPTTLVLDLTKAINLVLSADRRLGSARAALIQSETNVDLAESEFEWKIFPRGDAGLIGGGKAGTGITLGMGAEFSKRFTQGTRFTIQPSFMKAAKDYRSNVRTVLNQPLLRGFGTEYTLSALRGAEYANRSACRALYLTQVRLILQAVHGVYEIAKQEAFVSLERESLERIRKFCKSTQMKEKIGLCDALDVYRAEIELKHAEDNLNQSLDRLQEAKDMVRDTLALPLDQPIEVDVPIEYDPVVVSTDDAIGIALQNRVEIEQVDDRLEDALRLQYVAKQNLQPELNLVVDYTSFCRDELFTRAWTNRRESKWGVGFATSTDFDQYYDTAAYEQSILTSLDAERNVEQMHDNVVLDVKRTLRGLKRANERIKNQEEQIENTRKEFYLSQLKFEHGLANNFDLVQAEKNLRLAQTSLVSAVIDHKVGEFKLLAALGMLAEKP